jgi:hypothetical protein
LPVKAGDAKGAYVPATYAVVATLVLLSVPAWVTAVVPLAKVNAVLLTKAVVATLVLLSPAVCVVATEALGIVNAGSVTVPVAVKLFVVVVPETDSVKPLIVPDAVILAAVIEPVKLADVPVYVGEATDVLATKVVNVPAAGVDPPTTELFSVELVIVAPFIVPENEPPVVAKVPEVGSVTLVDPVAVKVTG